MTGIEAVEAINFPYTAMDLTEEIDRVDIPDQRIGQMGLFPDDPVRTEIVEISFRDRQLRILPTAERGSPPTVARKPDKKSVFLKIPHIPHKGGIKPEDLQSRFEWGSGRQQLDSVAAATARELEDLRLEHLITREFMRMGALKGEIYNGEYSLIYNLYEVFGITKKTISFALSNAATNVIDKCRQVRKHIRDNLKGEMMTGVHALVSQEFFTSLITHPNVEKYYLNWQQAAMLSGQAVSQFPFHGVVFEEYDNTSEDATGATRRYIAAGKGHAFAVGTARTFKTCMAPPYHVDYVNQRGLDILVTPKILDHGAGVELMSQSNALPVCSRPEMLVELTA